MSNDYSSGNQLSIDHPQLRVFQICGSLGTSTLSSKTQHKLLLALYCYCSIYFLFLYIFLEWRFCVEKMGNNCMGVIEAYCRKAHLNRVEVEKVWDDQIFKKILWDDQILMIKNPRWSKFCYDELSWAYQILKISEMIKFLKFSNFRDDERIILNSFKFWLLWVY
jgi:hypothetical protein